MFLTLGRCGTFHPNICTDYPKSSCSVSLCAISKRNMFDQSLTSSSCRAASCNLLLLNMFSWIYVYLIYWLDLVALERITIYYSRRKKFFGHCHKQSIGGTAGLRPFFSYHLAVFAKGCFGFIISKVNFASVAAFVGQVCHLFFVLLLSGVLPIHPFCICLSSISRYQ